MEHSSRSALTSRQVVFVLVLLWVFSTAMNITKPYHIDDTVHLETAIWIAEHPWSPMSGLINWAEKSEPIHKLNQPHLFFYLLAGWISVFGTSEIATHTLLSMFSLVSIVAIYGIAKQTSPSNALFITSAVALSPALVVSQNLMVDVPVLSLWCLFYYYLLKKHNHPRTDYIVAAILAGLACLTKYTSVVLLPVLLLTILIEKRYRLLWVSAIPFLILFAWSMFNLADYGSIHILGRDSGGISAIRCARMFVFAVICLGAIAPYTFVHALASTGKKLSTIKSAAIGFAVAMTVVLVILESGSTDHDSLLLLAAFGLNGGVLMFMGLGVAARSMKDVLLGSNSQRLVLILWAASSLGFLVLFTPFMAVRHVLPILVPVTVLFFDGCPMGKTRWLKPITLVCSALLTVALGVSDYRWAHYYREAAHEIAAGFQSERTVYFAGHWGWQWYASQSGMTQLDTTEPQCQVGDIIVVPREIHQQDLALTEEAFQLQLISTYSKPFSIFSVAKTDQARFYSSTARRLPWAIDSRQFGGIDIYEVVATQRQSASGFPPKRERVESRNRWTDQSGQTDHRHQTSMIRSSSLSSRSSKSVSSHHRYLVRSVAE